MGSPEEVLPLLLDGGIRQGCIFRLTCSHQELTKDHVLTSAYVKIFRTVTRNSVKGVFEGEKIVFDFP